DLHPQLLVADLIHFQSVPNGAVAGIGASSPLAQPGAHLAARFTDPARPLAAGWKENGHGPIVPADDPGLVGHKNEGIGLVDDGGKLLPLPIQDAEMVVERLEPSLVALRLEA